MPYRNVYLVRWVIVVYLLACLAAALFCVWLIQAVLLPKFNGLSTDVLRLLGSVITGSVKKCSI